MYKDRRIGVVIPAYNEERLISKTLETLPDFVDRVVVIDDGSEDATAEKVRHSTQRDSRIEILQSDLNQGVGAAVVRGYRHMLSQEVDLVAVMGGDAQSDPSYLTTCSIDSLRADTIWQKGTVSFTPSRPGRCPSIECWATRC